MAFPQTAAPTLYTGETNSHPVPMPATVNAGDLLVTMFGWGNGATLTAPTGWNVLHDTNVVGLFHAFASYRIADGTEDSTTVTYALSSSAKAAAHTYRFTAWEGTVPPEVGVATTSNGTTADPPNLAPSWGAADTLWLAIVYVNAGVGLTYPANYTDNTGNGLGGANGIVVGTTRRELNAAAEDPGTFTFSSAPWVAQTLAIAPVGAGPTVPTAPSNLAATALSTTSIGLTWDDNSSDETSFRVERSLTGAGGWVTAGTPAADAETFTDTGRTCGTQYFYRVFAVNGSGDSTASNTDDATTLACPPPATGGNRMGGSGAIRRPPRTFLHGR